MTSISLKNINKEFGDVVAVDDMNLEIEDGEFITFVGPSGCGKTTSLRLIAGLEQPSGGRIFFGDRDVTDFRPSRRNVGMVFQNLAIYPHMTVRENLEFGMDVANVDEEVQERRIEETAKMLDIADLLDRAPKQLSGGQQQRVAIGRTLVLDPDVFLLDEPLASLDAKLRVEIRQELQQLQDKVGITTIYVTHDQEQAMTMSDKIAVMNEGKLQQFATPQEVYHEPVNEFVAHFIGTPSINTFDCTVSHKNGSLVADTGFMKVPIKSDESGLVDRELQLGIRPEHVKIGDGSGDVSFDSTVDFIEYSGSQKIVHLNAENEAITAIVSEDAPLDSGRKYSVSFDHDQVNLFEATRDRSGKRLY